METQQPDRFVYGTGKDAIELAVEVPVFTCSDCGFAFTDDAAEHIRHDAVCKHLGVLTPSEIRAIRARTGLSRERFAALTGLGNASLARWETAELIQNVAHDRYLRLLAYDDNLERLKPRTESPLPSLPAKVIRMDAERAKRPFRALADSGRLDVSSAAAAEFRLRRTAVAG